MKILGEIQNKQHRKWNEKEISTKALHINSKKINRKEISREEKTKKKPKKNKQTKGKKDERCIRLHACACRMHAPAQFWLLVYAFIRYCNKSVYIEHEAFLTTTK